MAKLQKLESNEYVNHTALYYCFGNLSKSSFLFIFLIVPISKDLKKGKEGASPVQSRRLGKNFAQMSPALPLLVFSTSGYSGPFARHTHTHSTSFPGRNETCKASTKCKIYEALCSQHDLAL